MQIDIEGVLTADDYVSSNLIILRKNSLWIFAISSLALVLLMTIPDLVMGKFWENYTFLMAFAFILVMFLVVVPFSTRRNYKKSKKLQCPVYWQLTDIKIVIKTIDSENSFEWNEFKRYYETKNYIFFELKTPKRTAKFIPKRFFSGEKDIENLKKLLESIFDSKGELIEKNT